MPTIKIEAISAEAFAPYGDLLYRPQLGGPRAELIDELLNLRSGAKPRLSLAIVPAKPLPLVATEMERHIFSSQAFVPYDCDSYLVVVAPHDAEGGPDAAGLRAFRVPGDVAINYRPDTWHHPLTALSTPGRFVVMTFVDHTAGDEEFVPLPAAIEISE